MKRPAATAAPAAAADADAAPAAKAHTKTKGRPKGKARAPGDVTLKRPVAVMRKFGTALALNYRVKGEAGDEKRTRNVFSCKHCNRADTVFKNTHPKAAPEDRRASLGVIYSAASEFYSEKMRVSQ